MLRIFTPLVDRKIQSNEANFVGVHHGRSTWLFGDVERGGGFCAGGEADPARGGGVGRRERGGAERGHGRIAGRGGGERTAGGNESSFADVALHLHGSGGRRWDDVVGGR